MPIIIGGGILGVRLFNRWLMARITDALHANDNLAGAVVVMFLVAAAFLIGAPGGSAVYMITSAFGDQRLVLQRGGNRAPLPLTHV